MKKQNLLDASNTRESISGHFNLLKDFLEGIKIGEINTKEEALQEIHNQLRLFLHAQIENPDFPINHNVVDKTQFIEGLVVDIMQALKTVVSKALTEETIINTDSTQWVFNEDAMQKMFAAIQTSLPQQEENIANTVLQSELQILQEAIHEDKGTLPAVIKTVQEKKEWMLKTFNAIALSITFPYTTIASGNFFIKLLEDFHLNLHGTIGADILSDPSSNAKVSYALGAGMGLGISKLLMTTEAAWLKTNPEKRKATLLTVFTALCIAGVFNLDRFGAITTIANEGMLKNAQSKLTSDFDTVMKGDGNPIDTYRADLTSTLRSMREGIGKYAEDEETASARSGKGPLYHAKLALDTGINSSNTLPANRQNNDLNNAYNTLHNSLQSSENQLIQIAYSNQAQNGIDDINIRIAKEVIQRINEAIETVDSTLQEVNREGTQTGIIKIIFGSGRAGIIETQNAQDSIKRILTEEMSQIQADAQDAFNKVGQLHQTYINAIQEAEKQKEGGVIVPNVTMNVATFDLSTPLASMLEKIPPLEGKSVSEMKQIILESDTGEEDMRNIDLATIGGDILPATIMALTTLFAIIRRKKNPHDIENAKKELLDHEDTFVQHFKKHVNQEYLQKTIPGFIAFTDEEIGVFFREILEEINPVLETVKVPYQEQFSQAEKPPLWKRLLPKIPSLPRTRQQVLELSGLSDTPDVTQINALNNALQRCLKDGKVKENIVEMMLKKMFLDPQNANFETLRAGHENAHAQAILKKETIEEKENAPIQKDRQKAVAHLSKRIKNLEKNAISKKAAPLLQELQQVNNNMDEGTFSDSRDILLESYVQYSTQVGEIKVMINNTQSKKSLEESDIEDITNQVKQLEKTIQNLQSQITKRIEQVQNLVASFKNTKDSQNFAINNLNKLLSEDIPYTNKSLGVHGLPDISTLIENIEHIPKILSGIQQNPLVTSDSDLLFMNNLSKNLIVLADEEFVDDLILDNALS